MFPNTLIYVYVYRIGIIRNFKVWSTGTSITASWTPPDNTFMFVTNYDVRYETPTFSNTVITNVPVFKLTPLDPCTTYGDHTR